MLIIHCWHSSNYSCQINLSILLDTHMRNVLIKNRCNLKLTNLIKRIDNQDQLVCYTLPKLSGWMSKMLR
jgi:hypothetical protein